MSNKNKILMIINIIAIIVYGLLSMFTIDSYFALLGLVLVSLLVQNMYDVTSKKDKIIKIVLLVFAILPWAGALLSNVLSTVGFWTY